MIDTETYEAMAGSTDVYSPESKCMAYALGLASEAGEVAGKVKKSLRGDFSVHLAREDILYELGDVLWYVARMTAYLDSSLEEVMLMNLNKLRSRKERGVIKGSGDDR